MKFTFWTLAAVVAAAATFTDAVSINDRNRSTDASNFAQTTVCPPDCINYFDHGQDFRKDAINAKEKTPDTTLETAKVKFEYEPMFEGVRRDGYDRKPC